MALNSTKGYTLAEAMITVAIVGVLAAMAAPLMTQMNNFWFLTTARNTIQRDVRASLDTMNRFLRQGQSATVVIDRISTTAPPSSRITYTSVQGATIKFYQSGNKLYMSSGTMVSPLCSSLAYIAFTYPRTDDISLISVAMTTQASTFLGGKKALQLSIQKVRIMN